MNSKPKFILLLIVLAIISINYKDGLRGYTTDVSIFFTKKYMDAKNAATDFLNGYFDQRDKIAALKKQNELLEQKVAALNSFSSKLNTMLKDANLSEYLPNVKLVRSLSYVNMGDYNRVWLDFDGFDDNKIYGLLYQGYTAGIVTAEGSKAMAILQNDPKSTFSVYVGEEKIKGIVFGSSDGIEVKFIPLWTEPKIDDEVVTSGMDNIFFENIKVGRVVDVQKDESYFTAVVKPYASPLVPGFFYVVLN